MDGRSLFIRLIAAAEIAATQFHGDPTWGRNDSVAWLDDYGIILTMFVTESG